MRNAVVCLRVGHVMGERKMSWKKGGWVGAVGLGGLFCVDDGDVVV